MTYLQAEQNIDEYSMPCAYQKLNTVTSLFSSPQNSQGRKRRVIGRTGQSIIPCRRRERDLPRMTGPRERESLSFKECCTMQVIHRSENVQNSFAISFSGFFFAQMEGNEPVCVLQGSIWVCGSVWKCSFSPCGFTFESFVGKAHGSHPPTTPLTAEASLVGLALKTRGLNLQGVPPPYPSTPSNARWNFWYQGGWERERGVSVADSGDFFLPFCSTVGREGGSVGSLKGLFFRGGVRFVVSHLRQPSFPEIGGGEFFFLP